MTSGPRPQPAPRRTSIVRRLILAFVIVSLLPIAVFAFLSLREAGSDPAAHSDETGEAGQQHGTIAGVPIEFVELGVAASSLALSVWAAMWVGRTIVLPIRALEGSMRAVESGDLDASATVKSNDEIGHLSMAFNEMLTAVKREALVRDLFGQYVSPEVARLAIEQEGRLEGQVQHCTVLFVDIRRFTALAEVLPPARLIGTLNRYFERMLVAVQAEGGIVNKFGGDSLLAVFGSPLNPMPDHAPRAVSAALGMRIALRAFNAEERATEMPELQVGFGIASGEVVAGNIGSRRKLEYTVIGDPVNLAARLQELTPELGAEILVSAETARAVGDAAKLRSLGEIEVRGRAQRVEVFAVEESAGAEPIEIAAPSQAESTA